MNILTYWSELNWNCRLFLFHFIYLFCSRLKLLDFSSAAAAKSFFSAVRRLIKELKHIIIPETVHNEWILLTLKLFLWEERSCLISFTKAQLSQFKFNKVKTEETNGLVSLRTEIKRSVRRRAVPLNVLWISHSEMKSWTSADNPETVV